MIKQTSIKNTVATVISAVIVLMLIALCIVFSDYTLSSNQQSVLKTLLTICGSSILYCFIVGEITQNFSQMDKLWSLLPIAYTWVTAISGGMNLRLVFFAIIVTAWGIRLTINFARKGAYSIKFWTGEEDYRWAIVHSKPIFKHRIAWMAFNLFFISIYQNLLVLGICLPALACMDSVAPLCAWDIAAAILALSFLALETVSDEYQWKFHQTKKMLLTEHGTIDKLPYPYNLGFNTLGIWNVMRHPNYLGEQGIWLSLYLFAVGADVTNHGVFNWSATGALLLVLLFMGSSALGESISSEKYAEYRKYTERVYKYLPIRNYK